MSQANARSVSITHALLLTMTTIWAVNFSVSKYATTLVEPRAFIGLRVALAATVLVAAALVTRAPLPPRRDVLRLLAVGLIGHGVYQLLFIEGLARTRAGNAALIIAATPAFIATVSRWRGVERVRRRVLAGIALSMLGVGVIILGSATSRVGESSLLGTLLVSAGVLCWTTFTMGLQPFSATTNPLSLATITIVGGIVPLAFVTAPAVLRTDWGALQPPFWGALIYSSIISMVIAYFFWYRGVRVIGPTRTAVYANVQPMIALGVAWLTLGEVPTLWQGLGAATIITGVFFTRS